MVNLMIVGPSGHGKSTLLSHLKSMDKTISQPVTFHDRQMAYTIQVGTAKQSHCCKQSQLARTRNTCVANILLFFIGLNPTVGIDMDCFVHKGVNFITWDFSGQV